MKQIMEDLINVDSTKTIMDEGTKLLVISISGNVQLK